MRTVGTIAAIIVGVILIWIVIDWSAQRDEELNEWAEKYEECVAREYGGMTPTQYYQYHGEYPRCEVNH